MPSTIAIVAKAIGDLKAQTLSAMMATIEPVDASAKLGNLGAHLGGNPQAAMRAAEAAIKAVLVEMLPGGRALLQVAGGMVEAELPPEFLRLAAANPNLARPGTVLTLPADTPARPVTTPIPATLVTLSGHANGGSVGPAPPLASAFPAGTLGAAIARLAGIAFPQAEPEAAGTASGGVATAGFRPGLLVQQPLPPQLAEAILRAASRQMPLAPALSQILSLGESLGETETAQLPPALAEALRSLQTARATAIALGTAGGLQRAVAQSGLFLDANLANAALANTGVQQSIPADLKSILLTIRALLGGEAGAEAKPAIHSADAPAPSRHATAREAGEAPRLPELARVVEGALERVKLMQLASIPEHPEITVTDDRSQGMRLALAIPLATQGTDRPQTAVMGLVIEHQPQPDETAPYEQEKEGSGEAEPFPWKVRVALDLEETGPVQAEIALRGQSVAVTLWAERASMASRARDEIGALHEALTGAAFEVLKLEVKDGRPLGKAPPQGPRLDRRT